MQCALVGAKTGKVLRKMHKPRVKENVSETKASMLCLHPVIINPKPDGFTQAWCSRLPSPHVRYT